MKTLTIKPFLIYTLLAATTLAFTQPVFAEDKQPIAVVNIQFVMKDSTAAKSVREQLENKQKTYQAEIEKKQDSIKKEEQELLNKKSVLAKDAFEEKARVFKSKVAGLQKDAQSKKNLLDSAFERSLNDIQKVVTEIISDISKEKGFVIAVPTSQILFADTKLDISSEVLERLNKKLPKLDVKFDAPAADKKDDKK